MLLRFESDASTGGNPAAGVIFGSNGDLYGTTAFGGQAFLPSGTVFRLRSTNSGRTWGETILYNFSGGGFGGNTPLTGLIFDAKGDLYGTASIGGSGFGGTVFHLPTPSAGELAWTYTVLYSFKKAPDGTAPQADLIFDRAGNLYSTTLYGGTGTGCQQGGCGTVFELQR